MGKLLFLLLILSTNTPEENYIPKSNTVEVNAVVKDFLPIGWGTRYGCQLVEPKQEKPELNSEFFSLYTGVGFNGMHAPMLLGDTVTFHLMETNRYIDTNMTRSPSESGLVDKKNKVWKLISVE